MTHKMARDSRGWKIATVCGTEWTQKTTLSTDTRHITCPDCLKHHGYRIAD